MEQTRAGIVSPNMFTIKLEHLVQILTRSGNLADLRQGRQLHVAQFRFFVKTRIFNGPAHLVADNRHQHPLSVRVPVGLSVLYVDDTDHTLGRHDYRDRQKCIVTVFRKIVEDLETRILACVAVDHNDFCVLGDPSGNSLSHLDGDPPDQSGVGVFRCPQEKIRFGFVDEVEKAGIAACYIDHEVDNLLKHLIQVQITADRLADLMEYPQFLARQV